MILQTDANKRLDCRPVNVIYLNYHIYSFRKDAFWSNTMLLLICLSLKSHTCYMLSFKKFSKLFGAFQIGNENDKYPFTSTDV